MNALCLVGSERSIPLLEAIIANDPSKDYEGRPISEIAQRAINEIKDRRSV